MVLPARIGLAPHAAAGLTLYTHGLCPYAQRVAFFLEEKGVSYESIELDLSNKPSWLFEVSPRGLVPAVRMSDGRVQTESLDIVCNLEAELTGPPLVPPNLPAQKRMEELIRSSSRVESAGWAMLGGAWSFPRSGSPSSAAIREWDGSVVRPLADALDSSGGPFLCGPNPTLADVALAPFVTRFVLALAKARGYEALTGSSQAKAVRAWVEVLHARPSFAATFPERESFGRAIAKFCSLDYFDRHSASLAQPEPKTK